MKFTNVHTYMHNSIIICKYTILYIYTVRGWSGEGKKTLHNHLVSRTIQLFWSALSLPPGWSQRFCRNSRTNCPQVNRQYLNQATLTASKISGALSWEKIDLFQADQSRGHRTYQDFKVLICFNMVLILNVNNVRLHCLKKKRQSVSVQKKPWNVAIGCASITPRCQRSTSPAPDKTHDSIGLWLQYLGATWIHGLVVSG